MSFAIDFIIDHSSDDDDDRCINSNSYIFPWDENFNTPEDESQPLPKLKTDFQSSPITKSIPIISPQPPKPTIIKLVIPKTVYTRSTTPSKTQPSEITPVLQPKSNMSTPASQQEATVSQQETVTDVASEELGQKQEWVKRMRLKFSVRPEFEITKNILHPDGTLNQEYDKKNSKSSRIY